MPSAPSPRRQAGPGRPKSAQKRRAILQAAQRLFLANGFEGTSVDQIAAEAGVSKLTVYSHFGDKATLFAATIEHYCEQQVPAALFTPDPAQPLRPRLAGIARAVYALIASPEALSGFRLLCGPRPDPRLAGMFWGAGAGHLQEEFAALLARRTAAGELAVADPARAAGQFFALLRGDLHPRLLLGCDIAGGVDVDAHVEACVDLFMRAYACAPAG